MENAAMPAVTSPVDPVKEEVHRTLLLLSSDPILLGTLESWSRGLPDQLALEDLHNWNEAKLLELQEWLPTLTGRELEEAQQRIAAYEKERDATQQPS
jgi:hypothetical protein